MVWRAVIVKKNESIVTNIRLYDVKGTVAYVSAATTPIFWRKFGVKKHETT